MHSHVIVYMNGGLSKGGGSQLPKGGECPPPQMKPWYEWEWVGVVHSCTDSNFLQEVEKLEKQKKEEKDDEQRREVERLEQKLLEKDLANAKYVRH